MTHIKTVHEKRRDHACPYFPGVAFGRKSDLTKHINVVHLKLREHACPYDASYVLLRGRRLRAEDQPTSRRRTSLKLSLLCLLSLLTCVTQGIIYCTRVTSTHNK